MKVLFFADNAPVEEMYQPIIDRLPCQSVVAKTDYRMIEREKPDVIVLAREETTQEEHKIVDSGIPTLLVPHGMLKSGEGRMWGGDSRAFRLIHLWRLVVQGFRKLQKGDSPWRLLKVGLFRMRNDFKEKGILSRYVGFTKIACYGEVMRDILLDYKVKLESIVITGNPKFDKYCGLPQSKDGYVLLLTEYLVEFGMWTVKQREQYVKAVYEAVRQCGLDLVVKIHPVLENKEDYEKLVEKWQFRLCQHENLCELVSKCDMAITLMSTAGLDVMVAGKPLIIYNEYSNPTPYTSGVLYARGCLGLMLKIFQVKNGLDNHFFDEAKKFVYQQAYIQDGKASDRIADLIMEMEGANAKV